MAHCHAVRLGKPHPATSDANRVDLPLPLCSSRCSPKPRMWRHGDHALACPRTGLLARACLGPHGTRGLSEPKVRSCLSSGLPTRTQQASQPTTTAASTSPFIGPPTLENRCAATQHWCLLTRTGHPHPCTVEVDGTALKVAE